MNPRLGFGSPGASRGEAQPDGRPGALQWPPRAAASATFPDTLRGALGKPLGRSMIPSTSGKDPTSLRSLHGVPEVL